MHISWQKGVLFVLVGLFCAVSIAYAAPPSVGKYTPPEDYEMYEEWFGEDEYYFLKQQYWENAYMAIFRKNYTAQIPNIEYDPITCGTCDAEIAVIFLMKDVNGAWQPYCIYRNLTTGGGYGDLAPEDITLLRFNEDTYGFLVNRYVDDETMKFKATRAVKMIPLYGRNLFEIVTHYDNYPRVDPEKGYWVDVEITPEWDEKLKELNLHLTLTKKGKPSVQGDVGNTKDVLDLFEEGKNTALLFYRDGFFNLDLTPRISQ